MSNKDISVISTVHCLVTNVYRPLNHQRRTTSSSLCYLFVFRTIINHITQQNNQSERFCNAA